MAAWIGGLVAFNALGVPMPGDEWLGWGMAGLVAVIVRRATPPRASLTTPDRGLRILDMIAGAAGLVALHRPRNITFALAEASQIIAPGGRSSSALLQLIGLLLCCVLMVPPMLITRRSLRRTPRSHPDRLGFELRQNWYVSAATALVCCLLSAVCCLLSAVCCLLPAACCLLPAARADRELRSRQNPLTR